LKKTDDKYDVLYADDGEGGKKDINKDGTVNESDGLKVNDQSILSGLATKRDNYNGSYSITGGQKDAFNVFVFASDNSEAEWGLSGFTSKKGTSFVVSTSHDNGEVYAATSIKGLDFNTVENMQFKIHSHPNNYNFASVPDMINVKDIAWKYYDSKTNSYSAPIPSHYIYHPNSKSMIEYTPWNNNIPRGKIQTGVGLRRTIGLIK
jgi:hypothetical protein